MAGRLADILQLRRLRLGREQTATASSLSDSLTLSETTHHLPNRSPFTFRTIIFILTPTFTKYWVYPASLLLPRSYFRWRNCIVISCDSLFKLAYLCAQRPAFSPFLFYLCRRFAAAPCAWWFFLKRKLTFFSWVSRYIQKVCLQFLRYRKSCLNPCTAEILKEKLKYRLTNREFNLFCYSTVINIPIMNYFDVCRMRGASLFRNNSTNSYQSAKERTNTSIYSLLTRLILTACSNFQWCHNDASPYVPSPNVFLGVGTWNRDKVRGGLVHKRGRK